MIYDAYVSPSSQPVDASVVLLLEHELHELGVKTLGGYALPLDPEHAARLLARALRNLHADHDQKSHGNRGGSGQLAQIAASGSYIRNAIEKDPDRDIIEARGRGFSARNRVMKLGEPNQCHTNVAKLFASGKIDAIVTGYARGPRGWVPHSWGVKNGGVVETTYKYDRYFGAQLSAKESVAFGRGQGVTISKSMLKDLEGLQPWESVPKKPWHHELKNLGGPGSGNFGHAGRPGMTGGSSPSGVTFGAEAVSNWQSQSLSNMLSGLDNVTFINDDKTCKKKPDSDECEDERSASASLMDTINAGIASGKYLPPEHKDLLAKGIVADLKREQQLSPLSAYALASLADYASTAQFLRNNTAKETNPLINWIDNPKAMLAAGAAMDAAAVLTWVKMTKNHKKIQAVGLYAATFVRAGLALNNVAVDQWHRNAPQTPIPYAPVRHVDNRRVVFQIKFDIKGLASRGNGSTPIHDAADKHVPKLSVALRYAFAKGRKAIKSLLAERQYAVVEIRAVAAVSAALREVLPKMLQAVAVDGGKAGAELLNRQFRTAEMRTADVQLLMRFDAKNPAVIEWARKHAADLVTNIIETTRERIRLAVEELQEDGDFDFARDRILAAVGDEDRADLIARHETMLAAGEGQRLGWAQAEEEGLLSNNARREWIITPDERVCPICAELEGTTATLDGEYPGGFDGPPAHVQCRCTEGIIG